MLLESEIQPREQQLSLQGIFQMLGYLTKQQQTPIKTTQQNVTTAKANAMLTYLGVQHSPTEYVQYSP